MNMNKVQWNSPRNRKKTLLIVEGNHEKEKFLTRMLRAFPEINISKENILVYKTNIYVLLRKIEKEYGSYWYEQDIDLPYLVTMNNNVEEKETKYDYTDVFLIFDYERHDPNFSEEGILRMQSYFANSEDVGKLYINYPMIESYMDLSDIIDESYKTKKVSSCVKNGSLYKNKVKNTIIAQLFQFPDKIMGILNDKFGVDKVIISEFIEFLIEANSIGAIKDKTKSFFSKYLSKNDIETFTFQLDSIIEKLGYLKYNQSYNNYIKYVFQQITLHNVKKASYIQCSIYDIPVNDLKRFFYNIDEYKILEYQNFISDFNGLSELLVLNTSIFLLADYNPELVF